MLFRNATLCFDVNDIPGMMPAPNVPNPPAPAAPAPPAPAPAQPDMMARMEALAASARAAEEKVSRLLDARRIDAVAPMLADPDYVHLPAIQAVLRGPGMHDEFGALTDAAKAEIAKIKAAKPHLFRQDAAPSVPAPTAPKQTIPDLPAPDPAMGGRPMTIDAWQELARKDRAAAHQPSLLKAMGFIK